MMAGLGWAKPGEPRPSWARLGAAAGAMAAILSAAIALPVHAAACHHYSVWYYPRPQRCQVDGRVAREMARWPQAPSRRVAQITPTVGEQAILPSSPPLLRRHEEPDIALPGLASADLDGGEADEPTRAKVLLRAALEAANGH